MPLNVYLSVFRSRKKDAQGGGELAVAVQLSAYKRKDKPPADSYSYAAMPKRLTRKWQCLHMCCRGSRRCRHFSGSTCGRPLSKTATR